MRKPLEKARGRPGWERIRGGCGGIWRHVSGWEVHHCGHPTALWPYFGLPPGGQPSNKDGFLLTGGLGIGTAFRRLVLAQEAVEAAIATTAVTPEGNDHV